MAKRTRMSDVAKLAKVSTATVSRTLQNPEAVKEETRQKVFAAIEQLDYTPNILARQLRRMETNTILVVVPNIENNVFSQIVGGIDEVAHHEGYKVLLGNTNEKSERIYDFIDHFRQKQIDGMILLLSSLTEQMLQELSHEIPIVVTPDIREGVDVPSVTIDNVEWGRKATEHLLSLGHRRIAHIAGPLDLTSSHNRLIGYRKALMDKGISVDASLVKEGSYSFETGFDEMIALLKLDVPPTAVFCASDEIAFGAIKAIKEKGLQVPDDIAIIGFDNIKFSETFEPAITTIAQPLYEMGKKSMELLIERMNEGKLSRQHYIFNAKLVVRESCGAKA